MNAIPKEDWKQLFKLLDQFFDQDVRDRQRWLDSLPNLSPATRQRLDMLIAQRAELESADFLGSIPAAAAAMSSQDRALASQGGAAATSLTIPNYSNPTGFRSEVADPKEPARFNATPPPPQTGLVLDNQFELLEELGHGGTGRVFKALNRQAVKVKDRNPYVAVKVLNEDFKQHPEAEGAL